jgi:hypothetical protein
MTGIKLFFCLQKREDWACSGEHPHLAGWFSRHAGTETNFPMRVSMGNVQTLKGFQKFVPAGRRDQLARRGCSPELAPFRPINRKFILNLTAVGFWLD